MDVKGIREKLSLSVAKFAQVIGSSVHSVYNWENGRFQPSARMIKRIGALERGIHNPRTDSMFEVVAKPQGIEYASKMKGKWKPLLGKIKKLGLDEALKFQPSALGYKPTDYKRMRNIVIAAAKKGGLTIKVSQLNGDIYIFRAE